MISMGGTIREIHIKDRNRSIEIIIECLLKVNSKNYSPKFIKYLVKSYKKNFLRRPGIHTIIIEEESKILGTGSISPQGQIRDVFVDPKYHKKGYGKKLMIQLENKAIQNENKNLFLYSAVSAVDFYEKLGYIKVDQLEHNKKDVEIKMEKTL